MFQYTRDVPPEWQTDLESVVPKSDRVTWLKIVWQAGMPYEPVQRWELYEMTPNLDTVPLEVLQALKGPNPRSEGVWVPDPRIPESLGGKRWLSDSLVSLVQWELFRETGCYGQRFWIIQGSRGGHKWRLSDAEKNFLASFSAGGREARAPDTPLPGSRPYAEWNELSKQQIMRLDKLRKWDLGKPWEQRFTGKTDAGLYVKRDRYVEEQKFAKTMLKWLDTQIEEAVDDIPRSMLPSYSDLPEGDHYYNKDEDALERELVESTASAPPPESRG